MERSSRRVGPSNDYDASGRPSQVREKQSLTNNQSLLRLTTGSQSPNNRTTILLTYKLLVDVGVVAYKKGVSCSVNVEAQRSVRALMFDCCAGHSVFAATACHHQNPVLPMHALIQRPVRS